MFYINLTDNKSLAKSLVKGVKVTLTSKSFGEILTILFEGL